MRYVIALLWLILQAGAVAQNGLVYHVFVRSFADTAADTRLAGEIGDLRGLRENLGYIQDLGAGIVWLMPVFPSPTYHGYDVTDYRNINPDYGTLQDMRDLVAAAHERGLRILIDLPVNHTSTRHPWFQSALNDPASRYRNWYQFGGSGRFWRTMKNANGEEVRYFALFDSGMPDLNFEDAAVREEVKAIAKFWLVDVGVDGFRIDAAKHIFGDRFDALPESEILRNNEWWREFGRFAESVKPGALVVGEVLGDREMLRRHAWGSDALLDEPFMRGARDRISRNFSGFVNDWKQFVRSCRDLNPRLQPFPYLASHDEKTRLASFLEDRKQAGMQATVDQAYRLGLYLLMSVATHPVLYNGDEVMQRGYKWRGEPPPKGDGSGVYDETLREPFPWKREGAGTPQTSWFTPRFDKPNDGVSVEEQSGPESILSLTRALGRLRKEHPAFADGEVGAILSDSQDWLVFEKVARGTKYLVLINTTPTGMDYEFHDQWFGEYRGADLVFWSDGSMRKWARAQGQRIESKVFVPPYGFVLLKAH